MSQPAHTRRTRSTWLARIGLGLGGLLALVLIALAGVFVYLGTDGGRRFAADQISGAVSSPDGLQLEIGDTGGFWPWHIALKDVILKDKAGTWGRIGSARLSLSAFALLSGTVHVTEASFEGVVLDRLPDLPSDPAVEEEPAPFSWPAVPQLPVAVRVDGLEIVPAQIGAPVLGSPDLDGPVVLTLDGSAVWISQVLSVALDLLGPDGASVTVALSYEAPADRFAMDLKAGDQAGGLVSRLAGIPDLGTLSLKAKGNGTGTDWSGDVAVVGGGYGSGAMTMTGGWRRGHRLHVEGTFEPGPALPRTAHEALGGVLSFGFAANAHGRIESVTGLALEDLTIAAGPATLKGRAGLAEDGSLKSGARITADLEVNLTGLPDIGVPVTLGGAQASIQAQGDLGLPELTLTLTGESVAWDGGDVRTLQATLNTGAADGKVTMRMEGFAEGFNPGLDEEVWPFGDRLTLNLEGGLDPQAAVFTLERLRAGLEGLDLTASGRGQWNQPSGNLSFDLTTDRLGELVTGLDQGRVGFSGVLRMAGPDRPVFLDLTGKAENLKLSGEEIRTPGDGTASLTLKASAEPSDQTVRLSELDLSVFGEALTLSGRGEASAARIETALLLRAADLEPFAPLLGIPVAGSLMADLVVEGTPEKPGGVLTLSSPAFRVRNLAVSELVGDFGLDPVADGFGITAALTMKSQLNDTGEPAPEGLMADLTIHPSKSGVKEQIQISQLKGSLFGLSLSELEDRQGVRLSSDSLGNIGAAVRAALGPDAMEMPLPAAGLMSMNLSWEEGLMAAVEIRDLLTTTGIGLDRFGLSARLDGSADQVLDASLRLKDLRGIGLDLEKLDLDAAGPLANPVITVSAREIGDQGLKLDGVMAVLTDPDSPDAGITARIDELDVRRDRAGLRLDGPARIVTGGSSGGVLAEDLRFVLAHGGKEGAMTVSLRTAGRDVDAQVSLVDVPARVLTIAPGAPDLAGTLGGRMTVGLGDRNAASINLNGTGLFPVIPGEDSDERDDPADLTLALNWDGTKADLRAGLTGSGGENSLTAEGFLTFTLGKANEGSEDAEAENGGGIGMDDPWRMQIRGAGPLSAVTPVLPLPDHRMRGTGKVDLTLSGTPSRTILEGTVAVEKGAYDHLATGFALRQVNLTVDAGERTLDVKATGLNGEGKLKGAGRLTAEGTDLGLQGDLSIKSLTLMDRDDVTVKGGGDIAIAGTLADGIDITGKLRIEDALVSLAAELPPTVVDLETTDVHGLTPVAEVMAEAEEARESEEEATVPIRLDIDMRADDAIRVDGRGLESVWNSRIKVSGTGDDPRLAGEVTLKKGKLEFADKEFTLTQGVVTLNGGREVDPRLLIRAQRQTPVATAIITISGPASDPLITLSSEPALSQDAILAQLLFGKNPGELTPVELFQLGQALASLSSGGGGGFDILGRAQAALGLDVLEVGADLGDETSGPSVNVTVGKYVTDKVYVGVSQGSQPGTTAVSVEVQLTDHLLVHTDVSQNADNTVGLRWRWDY